MKKPTPKMQKAKKITLDDLVMMVQWGFMEMSGRIDQTNRTVEEHRTETKNGFARIENVLLRGHENRIEKIEDDTRILKTAVLR